MSEIKRKRGESFEGFMRRVKQQWLRSGKLLEVRKGQYFEPKPNKNQRHKQAVARVKRVTELKRLERAGKLPAQPEFAQKNKR